MLFGINLSLWICTIICNLELLLIWFCSHWKWGDTVNILPSPLLVWRFCYYFGLKCTKQQYSSLEAANICFVNLWGWCLVLLITTCLQEGSLCCVDCNNKQTLPFSWFLFWHMSFLKHFFPKMILFSFFFFFSKFFLCWF